MKELVKKSIKSLIDIIDLTVYYDEQRISQDIKQNFFSHSWY